MANARPAFEPYIAAAKALAPRMAEMPDYDAVYGGVPEVLFGEAGEIGPELRMVSVRAPYERTDLTLEDARMTMLGGRWNGDTGGIDSIAVFVEQLPEAAGMEVIIWTHDNQKVGGAQVETPEAMSAFIEQHLTEKLLPAPAEPEVETPPGMGMGMR